MRVAHVSSVTELSYILYYRRCFDRSVLCFSCNDKLRAGFDNAKTSSSFDNITVSSRPLVYHIPKRFE